MKLLITLLILITNICLGQEIIIDSCGLDNSPTLNKYEVQYFNQSLDQQKNLSNFNFQNKKIGFASGNFGKDLISKQDYFNRWGKAYFENGSHVVNLLIILTEEEKEQSGGYDAIIISWSKIELSKKHKDRLIKKLKEDPAASNG